MPGRRALLAAPDGATRVAAVIGDPVHHSLSPVLHNAAFTATGINWVYVAFRVEPGEAAGAVAAMRNLGLAGMSVTMPHKADAAAAVDRLGPVASELGVINTVSWAAGADGELYGESTDGAGFIDALKGDEGFDPDGRRCTVLGAGGAARAVTLSLARAGAARVSVVGRRVEAVGQCAALAGDTGIAVAARDDGAAREAVREADLVVNATPAGMEGQPLLPVDLEESWLNPQQFVADLVYAPAITPLLAAARRVGASNCNGLGMLVHQAGRQFEIWTGRPAPLAAMSARAVGALTHRAD